VNRARPSTRPQRIRSAPLRSPLSGQPLGRFPDKVPFGERKKYGEHPCGSRLRLEVRPSGGKAAGFWAGVWHGLICPITFLVSLFSPSVRIYEVNNRGRWYDFGFIIGVSCAFGGGGSRVAPWQ